MNRNFLSYEADPYAVDFVAYFDSASCPFVPDELTSQLQLERARVGELEAQLRAARIDYNVALVAEGLVRRLLYIQIVLGYLTNFSYNFH